MKKKVLLYSIFLFLIDQISKFIFDKYFILNQSNRICEKFFYITLAHNEGVSFSMLQGSRIIIIIITILILIFLYKYQPKFKENTRNTIAFSLVYGGLLGNLFDRIIHGYVIDFLDFYIFSYDFPIFNIADICICFGIGLLIYAIYGGEDNEDNSKRRNKSKTR